MSTLAKWGKVMVSRDEHARKGCQMGFKVSFVAGFAVGYVVGTAAGRERYEQMKKMAQQTANHPAVQRATQTASARATEFGKMAGQKATERVPKLAESAKSGTAKVRGQLDRRKTGRQPAGEGAQSDPAVVNGIRPAD